MKKYISTVSLSALFLINAAGLALAQEETAIIAPEETITVSDLGVSNAGILPTSPFYFFKEWSRNLRSFATFNPIAKTELELKFTNEKAAELKQVSENQPESAEAMQKAMENYQASQEKLRIRFEGLKETSQNPNMDKLLNKLTDRVVKHEKLFDEINLKFKNKEGVAEAVKNAMAKSQEVVGEAAKKDDPAKFSSRLEKVLLEEKGGGLKHARSVEIIDRLSEKTPNEIKESLGKLRIEFSEKLEVDIKNLIEEKGEEALNNEVAKTPGNFGKRSVIIEEIQKRAEERLSEALGKALNHVEKIMEKEADAAKKAKEQIERAEKIIQEAERKISESSSEKVPEVASTLLAEAKEHLKNAKSALIEEKYGEAFGQARSAEVLARNAMRFSDRERPAASSEIKQIEKPTVAPLKPALANRCEEITKNITELKELLASKRIGERDFQVKYDERIRKLIICQGEKNTATPSPTPTVKQIEPVQIQVEPIQTNR